MWWNLPRTRQRFGAGSARAPALHRSRCAISWLERYACTTPGGALGAHSEGNTATVDLFGGVRRDPDAVHLYDPMFVATAAFWIGEMRAWTVSLSKLPPDFVRGADAASSLSIGMRLFESSPARSRAERARPVLLVAGAGEQRVLRVRASGAHTVELMADFTNWTPVTLTPGEAGFERTFTLAAGTHHVVVRIDGASWRPATNTPAVDDDLGGRVGLLVVP